MHAVRGHLAPSVRYSYSFSRTLAAPFGADVHTATTDGACTAPPKPPLKTQRYLQQQTSASQKSCPRRIFHCNPLQTEMQTYSATARDPEVRVSQCRFGVEAARHVHWSWSVSSLRARLASHGLLMLRDLDVEPTDGDWRPLPSSRLVRPAP